MAEPTSGRTNGGRNIAIGGAVVIPLAALATAAIYMWRVAAATAGATNQLAAHETWIKEKGEPAREQVVRLDERLKNMEATLIRIEHKLNARQ